MLPRKPTKTPSKKPNRRTGVVHSTSLLHKRFCAWLHDGCGQDLARGMTMLSSRSARTVANLSIASALTLFLGACGGGGFSLPSLSSSSAPAPEPGMAPEVPATIRSGEIVGKWGLASYQNP